jgi:hypothetical protein
VLEAIIISDEEMASLPEGIAGFLAYEALCRAKLAEALKKYGEHDDDMDVRISYLTNILSAADHFDVPVLKDMVIDVDASDFGFAEARASSRIIDREITRLRFAALRESRPTSVAIEPAQQVKLEHQIEQLRQRVRVSHLDEAKRRKLNGKLDDLLSIIKAEKTSLRDTTLVLGSLFTTINQAEGAVIMLPDTLAAILEVLGFARETADQKALESKSAKPALTDQRPRDAEGGGASVAPT